MSILDCYGQNRAVNRLAASRRAHRVPHSYIFHGPEGVGKMLLARQWAKLMFCSQMRKVSISPQQNNTTTGALDEIDDCCDQCPDCHLADSGNHPDLHIINRKLGKFTSVKRTRQLVNLPIDVIREFIIKPAGSRPSRGRARVFIIDDAHSMAWQAQNALLKTLEEPPPSTFLILITAQPDLFLPTIRSRCHSVGFAPLPREYIYQQLKKADIADQESRYWSAFCNGRLGLALRLGQLDFYGVKCRLVEQLAHLDRESVLKMAAWLVDTGKAFSQAFVKQHPDRSPSDATKQGYSCLLELICHTFSETLHYQIEDRQNQLDQPEMIKRLAGIFTPLAASGAIRAAGRAQERFRANVNPALIFESLLLEYLE